MEAKERKLIVKKAMEMASNEVETFMTDEDLAKLPDEERAIAVIESVALTSMVSLSTLVEIFGEESVDSVMMALNAEMEEAEEDCDCDCGNCGNYGCGCHDDEE